MLRCALICRLELTKWPPCFWWTKFKLATGTRLTCKNPSCGLSRFWTSSTFYYSTASSPRSTPAKLITPKLSRYASQTHTRGSTHSYSNNSRTQCRRVTRITGFTTQTVARRWHHRSLKKKEHSKVNRRSNLWIWRKPATTCIIRRSICPWFKELA